MQKSHAKAAVVHVGTTGSSKSTLGNPSTQDEVFKRGTDNLPTTQSASTNVEEYSSVHHTVIDTPGLNESDAADKKHTKGITQALEKVQKISACAFVVKFDAPIDSQYKHFLPSSYLPYLLRMLFVMTNYATDARSVFLRQINT